MKHSNLSTIIGTTITVQSAFKGIVSGKVIALSDMKLLHSSSYIKLLCDDGDELIIHKSSIIK